MEDVKVIEEEEEEEELMVDENYCLAVESESCSSSVSSASLEEEILDADYGQPK